MQADRVQHHILQLMQVARYLPLLSQPHLPCCRHPQGCHCSLINTRRYHPSPAFMLIDTPRDAIIFQFAQDIFLYCPDPAFMLIGTTDKSMTRPG
jgi:hypothetical protein